MPRGFLIDEGNGDSRIPMGETFVLGRIDECDFVLQDSAASRRHMEIVFDDGQFTWRDLDSTNGVYVNERRLEGGTLETGDRIRIGGTSLRFEVDDSPDAEKAVPTPAHGDSEHIVQRLTQFSEAETRSEADLLLDAVHRVMNDIASNYEPCSLVDRILETTMRAIDGQRGAVFFASPGQEGLRPCPVCGHVHVIENGELKHSDARDIHISQTVAKRVLEDGESVLVQDMGSDAELNVAASVMALNLRSIICAPVRGKYGVLGILYVDSDRPDQSYSRAQMLLSQAVGNSAGLALENAKMHQEILQKQRTDQEIELAGIIQEGFLVHEWPGDDTRYDVFAETRPAKVVGGDFYDVVRLDADRVGVLIGDVSGKGVGAALAMAQILAEFRVLVTAGGSAVDIMAALNDSMCERSQRGMFCTLCYLCVDLKTGAAQSVNAGHHAVLRVNRHDTSEMGGSSGFPIGIVPGATWEVEEFELAKGDTVYLYTDGIAEARSAKTQHEPGVVPDEYGVEALGTLGRELVDQSAEVIVREVLKDVQRYCEPIVPHDDCTLAVLRYLG